MPRHQRQPTIRLLLFNLATDASDPVLGFTTQWISGLASRCEYVDVVTMRSGQIEVPENVRVFSVGGEKSLHEPGRALNFYRILHDLLSQRSYDCCFAHMMPLFAVMACPYLKAKKIPLNLWYAHKSTANLVRIAEKVVDRVISSSAEGFRIPSKKLVITGQGIDTNLFRPSGKASNQPLTILSLGRIAPIKNLEVLIDAAAEMSAAGTGEPFRVRIVGPTDARDKAYESMLRRRVAAHYLQEIVEFGGPVRWSETVQEYQQADVMVNLGGTGSLDKAVLEAMSCGVPAVTSNPPFARLISPVDERLILSRADSTGVAKACNYVLRMNHFNRRLLGERLREVVERDHSFQRLMNLLVSDALITRSAARQQVRSN